MVIVNEHDNHDRQRLDSSLVYISAHNVLNMLNDCTRCWHLAFCNELPDVVTCFLAQKITATAELQIHPECSFLLINR
ncbi:hypothetical protein BON98_00390 [Escherichia coli]|nr:hypothetical protein BON98_00390 [Escherichia coli]